MNKTIAYVRVSTNKQTVENQINEISNYATKNQILINEFIKIEITSRKNVNERKITDLINKLGKDGLLIVSELSRLGRSSSEVMNTLDILSKNNVHVIMIKENLELKGNQVDPMSKMMVTILSAFVELERNLISQRTKEALSMRKGKGQILGRKTGSLSKSQYDIKDNEILELFNKNVSATTIVKLIGYGSAKTILEWKKKRVEHNKLLDTLCFNEAYRNFKENK